MAGGENNQYMSKSRYHPDCNVVAQFLEKQKLTNLRSQWWDHVVRCGTELTVNSFLFQLFLNLRNQTCDTEVCHSSGSKCVPLLLWSVIWRRHCSPTLRINEQEALGAVPNIRLLQTGNDPGVFSPKSFTAVRYRRQTHPSLHKDPLSSQRGSLPMAGWKTMFGKILNLSRCLCCSSIY